MKILSDIFAFFKLGLKAMSSDSVGAGLQAVVKYGPLIASVVELIEQHKTEAKQQFAATEFERGFRVLTQTKNPKPLMAAIYSHCGDDGCMLP